jgi:hypothetical protein
MAEDSKIYYTQGLPVPETPGPDQEPPLWEKTDVVGKRTPREIAFSIVGELIEQRRKDAGRETGRHPAGCGNLPADGDNQAAAACAG